MKLIHLIAILLLFVLLGNSCKTYGQSNSFTTDELRQIATALNEHDFLAEQDSLNTLLLIQYANVIMDYKTKEVLFNKKEQNYKILIDELKPAWYNNFLTGSSVTTVIFLLLISLFN